MKKNKFNYNTLEELKSDINRLGINLPIDERFDVLLENINLKNRIIPNRFVINPMEGADANQNGSPGKLTLRRYRRYAEGGAGLIWFEATAVNESGKANNQQLYINKNTVNQFKNMVDMIRDRAKEVMGDKFNPYLVLQLTHSGRFGENKNILFHHDFVDETAGVSKNVDIMTDKELEELEKDYLEAAKLAEKTGFDAVDVKSCHRYLLSENLAAFSRNGKFGGNYENRTRLLKNILKKIKNTVNIDLAVRLNIFDAIPYPFGWGADKDGNEELSEPKKIVKELEKIGVKLINATAASPHIYPHITRPYDFTGNWEYEPSEHPLVGVERLLKMSRVVNKEIKDAVVVGTGFSWLRQYGPFVAAGVVNNGWATMVGFGRQAFAYPDFARDIIENGKFDPKKVCVTCSKCAELKANKKNSGCVVRDREVYIPIYKDLLKEYENDE